MKVLSIVGFMCCVMLSVNTHAAKSSLGVNDTAVFEHVSIFEILPVTDEVPCDNGGLWQQYSDNHREHFLYTEGNTPIIAILAPDDGEASVIAKDEDTWWVHRNTYLKNHLSGATYDWFIRTSVVEDAEGIAGERPQTIARCFAGFWMN